MNTKLIIVADLGLLRAYRQTQSAADRQPHLKLIAELKPATAHESDQCRLVQDHHEACIGRS